MGTGDQRPVSRKSRNFSGAFRVTLNLFASSKRWGLETQNFIIYFNFYPLYKIWKDQLYRVSRLEC